MAEEKNKNDKPVKKYMAYPVSVSIWKNMIKGTDGKEFAVFKCKFQKSYKDDKGVYQNIDSFDAQDLGKLALVARKAEEYSLLARED